MCVLLLEGIFVLAFTFSWVHFWDYQQSIVILGCIWRVSAYCFLGCSSSILFINAVIY